MNGSNPSGSERVLSIFEEISAIPRCSKEEERVCAYLRRRTEAMGFSVRRDGAGNLSVRVPGSVGCEAAPTVVIQAHMDMVCEKRSGSDHDFSRDPIRLVEEDGWLKADGTTLGADNGIGMALALALVEDDTLARPPVELLFTVDEETGLTGANRLEPGFFSGRVLLNIDSEDEGVFTVGCAGGVESRIRVPVAPTLPEPGAIECCIEAAGMRGGHSGVDIHKQRANAIRVLCRALDAILRTVDIRLIDLKGGKSHNAIPRSAAARFACPADRRTDAADAVRALARSVRLEYADTDPSLTLTFSVWNPEAGGSRTLTVADTFRVVRLLLALPGGVLAMSKQIEGLVETSCNLASATLADGCLEVVTSQRSSLMSRLEEATRRIESTAALAGGDAARHNAYPAWEPNLDSPLLDRCRRTYRSLFGREPAVEAVHAGLECAVIGAACDGMDMISFGPTIRDPHSPDEALELASVKNVWAFSRALLASLAQKDDD